MKTINMLDHFEKIIKLAKEDGFNDAFFENSKVHLDAAAEILHTNTIQTAIFALILDHFGEYSVALDDIAKTIKCEKIQLIKYMDDIEDLQIKRLIRETSSGREIPDTKSGPDQTENAIQNIILQEMEDLNGILIATTNMTINLDKAFQRRFLYKIEFDKPDLESKKMIWKIFIPSLSEDDGVKLASQFDFSGGQIENIARRRMVSLILSGAAPEISGLEDMCREELMIKETVSIGFNT